MECKQAYFYLNLRGRGSDDLGSEATAELDQHLSGCPDCAAFARWHAAEDMVFARAMKSVPVPDGLRARLHRNLQERTRQRSRLRGYRLACAAASVLLAVGIGFGFNAAARPRLNLDELVLKGDFQFENPDETTRQWLAEQKLPERLPMAFNLSMLVFRGSERIQGRDVPVLVFHDNRDPHTPRLAKLYFFRDEQFANLNGVPTTQSSYFQTKILRDDREHPGLSFVILYTGQTENDLKVFLRPQNAA